MRNLHLNDVSIKELPLDSLNVKKFISKNDIKILFIGDNVFYQNSPKEALKKLNQNKILGVDCNQVENVIYMGSSSAFECFNIENEVLTTVNIPQDFDVYAWNPSQDQIVLYSRTGLIRVVTIDSYSCEYVELASYTIILNEDDIKNNETAIDDSEKPVVKWSKCGTMFAVSVYNNNKRTFQIFSANCEYLHTNEIIPETINLRPILAWKPDSSTIANLQVTESNYNIIFFEKNGLYKNVLPITKKVPVTHFEWNNQGNVFLTLQRDSKSSYLSLYSFSNNVWYLKQSLIFNDEIVNNISWKNTKKSHIKLEIVTSKNLITYTWNWGVDTIKWIEENCRGIVAVINNNELQITEILDKMIPPPSSTFKLNFKEAINFVKFSPNGEYMVVVLNDYTVEIFKISKTGLKRFPINLHRHLNIYNNVPLSVNNFIISNNMVVYAVQTSPYFSYIMKFETNFTELKGKLHASIIYNTNNLINHLSLVENNLIINTNNDVICFKSKEDTVEIMPSVPKGDISILYLFEQYWIFSLSGNEFYLNGDLLTDNITSYIICHGYILLSTVDNFLHCYKLSSDGLAQLKSYNTINVYSRSIPKDGLLITSVPRTRTVTIQLPRGDLEIIKPRVLSINLIQSLLSQSDYKEAFMIVRQDRLNPNIIIDINPDKFVLELEKFVNSIGDCELLNLFIISLQDHGITQEIYGKCFENKLPTFSNSNSKRQIILDELIRVMKILNRDQYMQSIITAYVCKKTEPDMVKALEELNRGIKYEDNGGKLPVSIDEIFNRIVTLVTAERLFNVALLMQDFHLIQWIASKTQLDPLEYIPFLEELNNMNPDYRLFKINNHLKFYEEAFLNLIKCNDVEDELVHLVTKNNLYKLILKYVPSENQWHKVLMKCCGLYMEKLQHYEEAGLIFKRIGCYEEAVDNYIAACNLQESLNIINFMQHEGTTVSLENLFKKLSANLVAAHKYKDASYVFENHLSYYEQGIKLLIHGKLWTDAFNMAHRHHRFDIINTELKPALLQYISELSDMFEQKKKQFLESKERLNKLRKSKMDILSHNTIGGETMLEENLTENIVSGMRDIDFDSIISVNTTTTRQTGHTNLSSTSSRRKKKMERKTLQTREGSMFENIALIRQLHNIIIEVQGYSNIIREVCFFLLNYDDCYEESSKLHCLYDNVLDTINNSLAEIWPPEFLNPPEPITLWAVALRQNIEQLETQFRYPPIALKPHWKLYSLTS